MSKHAQAKEKIMEYLPTMNLYVPNVSTWIQYGVMSTKEALEELVQEGKARAMKTFRYHGQVMSEFTVPFDEEFNWDEIQDPDDFTPIDPLDVEIIRCYRTIK